MEDDLNFFQMEDDLNFFVMEDNLNFVLGNPGSWFSVSNCDLTFLIKEDQQNIKKIMQPKTIKFKTMVVAPLRET